MFDRLGEKGAGMYHAPSSPSSIVATAIARALALVSRMGSTGAGSTTTSNSSPSPRAVSAASHSTMEISTKPADSRRKASSCTASSATAGSSASSSGASPTSPSPRATCPAPTPPSPNGPTSSRISATAGCSPMSSRQQAKPPSPRTEAERAAKLFGAAEEIREHFGAQFSNSEAEKHDEIMKKLATLLPKDTITRSLETRPTGLPLVDPPDRLRLDKARRIPHRKRPPVRMRVDLDLDRKHSLQRRLDLRGLRNLRRPRNLQRVQQLPSALRRAVSLEATPPHSRAECRAGNLPAARPRTTAPAAPITLRAAFHSSQLFASVLIGPGPGSGAGPTINVATPSACRISGSRQRSASRRRSHAARIFSQSSDETERPPTSPMIGIDV